MQLTFRKCRKLCIVTGDNVFDFVACFFQCFPSDVSADVLAGPLIYCQFNWFIDITHVGCGCLANRVNRPGHPLLPHTWPGADDDYGCHAGRLDHLDQCRHQRDVHHSEHEGTCCEGVTPPHLCRSRRSAARSDPAAAEKWIGELPPDLRAGATIDLAATIGESDSPEATRILTGIEEPDRREIALTDHFERLAELDPQAAHTHLLEAPIDEAMRASLLASAMASLLRCMRVDARANQSPKLKPGQ